MTPQEIDHIADSGKKASISCGQENDLIFRQAAIDALDCINGVEEVLRSLPSAQPEIIRCKDCEHWKNEHLCESLSRFGSFETKADFYCGYAERKTDE